MAKSLPFWFRRKYNLAPTDPRYLDASLDEIETDFWAHFYHENKVSDEVEDEEFDQEAIMQQWAKQAEGHGDGQDEGDWEKIIDFSGG